MPRSADGSTGLAGGACARVRERIDPLLDGELSPGEEATLHEHLAGCPACRSEVALARSLQVALRDGLPPLTCPPAVTARVLAAARRQEEERERRPGRSGLGARLRDWLGDGGLLRPALAAVALAVLLAGPFVYRSLLAPGPSGAPGIATLPAGPPPDTGESPDAGRGTALAGSDEDGGRAARYSPAEVAEARAQARLVFAYLASVGQDAGRAVQDDVFGRGIVRPARRAVENLGAVEIAEPRRKP